MAHQTRHTVDKPISSWAAAVNARLSCDQLREEADGRSRSYPETEDGDLEMVLQMKRVQDWIKED